MQMRLEWQHWPLCLARLKSKEEKGAEEDQHICAEFQELCREGVAVATSSLPTIVADINVTIEARVVPCGTHPIRITSQIEYALKLAIGLAAKLLNFAVRSRSRRNPYRGFYREAVTS